MLIGYSMPFHCVDAQTHCTPDEAGYYAGWFPQFTLFVSLVAGYLAAAMMLGRVLTSVAWGSFADNFGRKPVLLIGCACIVFTSIGFGLSTNYAMAISMRFLLGFFNPIIGIAKTLVSEVCFDPNHEARGMGLLTGTWGLGMIFGPAMGGMLSNPTTTFPSLFGPKDGVIYRLFDEYPYLLPNLGVAMIGLVTGISIAHAFVETLPVEARKSYVWLWEQGCLAVTGLWDAVLRRGSTAKVYEAVHTHEESDQHCPSMDSDDVENPLASDSAIELVEQKPKEEEEAAKNDPPAVSDALPSLYEQPMVRSVVMGYFLLSMVSIMFDEIFPLWLLSSYARGGMEYTAMDIGTIMSYSGFVLIAFTSVVYPWLTQYMGGAERTFLLGLQLASPMIALISFLWPVVYVIALPSHGGSASAYVAHHCHDHTSASHVMALNDTGNALSSCPLVPGSTLSGVLYVLLFVFYAMVKVCTTCSFTSIALLINRSVHPTQRASINGLAMTAGSLAKTLGPPIGGMAYAFTIWSWTEHATHHWINYHTLFLLVAIGTYSASLFTFPVTGEKENALVVTNTECKDVQRDNEDE